MEQRRRPGSARLSVTEAGVVVGLAGAAVTGHLILCLVIGAVVGVALDWWLEGRDGRGATGGGTAAAT